MPARKGSSNSNREYLNAQKRIQRELMEYKRSNTDQTLFHIETVNDDVCDLRGHIFGPPDSPFAGGVFKLEVKIPPQYPFSPPKVKFITRLWHPNVSSQTGTICLDILKDQWAASLTLRTVMLSLTALLCSPEPDDPQDAVVAKQYKTNLEMYKQTAAFWTLTFANSGIPIRSGSGGPSIVSTKFPDSFDEKVRSVMSQKRCDRATALAALSWNNWVVHKAVETLS